MRLVTLRRTGMVTLLVAGAMVLSGCWGVVVGPDSSGKKALVLTPAATGQLVKVHCGGRATMTAARCVLNSVWDLCNAVTPRNMTLGDCYRLASWQYSPGIALETQVAITNYLIQGDGCLVGYFGPGHGIHWTASRRGFACN